MSRSWAVARVGLGTAQVMGATVIMYLLLTAGMTDLTMWATAMTIFLIVLSRLLFAILDRKE